MPNWAADDGSLIHYEVHGAQDESRALLLLPGLLGSISSQWPIFVDELRKDYRVVLMDLRGHGRSENRTHALRAERMVQDICGLLDYLQVETVHVAGYSLGGYLGLMMQLTEPRRVSTLLMHATKFYWNEESVMAMRRQLDPDSMVQKVPAYADQLVKEHGGRWRQLVRQAGDLVAMMAQEGVTEGMVRRVQIPVLVSVGDRDELVTLPEAARLARAFPLGQLLVLPGVKHPFTTVPRVPLLPMMQQFHQADARVR